MQSVNYYVLDAIILTLIPSYSLIPAGCQNELNYKVTMEDDSDLFSGFTFIDTSGLKAISVYTKD